MVTNESETGAGYVAGRAAVVEQWAERRGGQAVDEGEVGAGPEGGDAPCWAHMLDDGTGELPEPMLARLVRGLADAVVVADPQGRIVFWNLAAERVFGWSAAEALGRSLDLIIPDRQRPAHWDGYAKVMQTGETRYGDTLLRVPSLHADGQRRSIAFTVTLLQADDGSVAGIAAVVRDETERWNEERELRRQLREATA